MNTLATRLLRAALAGLAALGAAGCTVYRTVAAPVKLTAKTVTVVGGTTVTVASAGGKIVSSGAGAVGALGGIGIDAAARLAKADMVTFVNVADGRVTRVPWREGLRVSGAASAGRVELAAQGVELIRDGRVVAAARHAADALAAAGDVVRVLH